jgi:Nuclease-related domain
MPLPYSPVRPARTRTQAHRDDRRAGSWPLMRVVWLSDHPGDMLQHAQQQRAAEDRDKHLDHDNALATHRQHAARLRDTRDKARAQHRWGAWLRGVIAVSRANKQIHAARLPASQPTDEEQKLAAGAAGEQLVAEALARALGDDWVLFRGYSNGRGEIDHVLLGPRGLCAIEVKNHNARIDCYGDQWWSIKYDKYGNPVGPRREMSDNRGRSPSVQLNEPASQLTDFLRSRGHPIAIERVVVLTHRHAQLRTCTRPTVHVCTSVRQILKLLNATKVSIGTAERAQLERLIVQDHRFHKNRRSR